MLGLCFKRTVINNGCHWNWVALDTMLTVTPWKKYSSNSWLIYCCLITFLEACWYVFGFHWSRGVLWLWVSTFFFFTKLWLNFMFYEVEYLRNTRTVYFQRQNTLNIYNEPPIYYVLRLTSALLENDQWNNNLYKEFCYCFFFSANGAIITRQHLYISEMHIWRSKFVVVSHQVVG